MLILHAVVGAALVGAATHLVVWTWGFWRRKTARARGVRRFAWIVVALFAANLLLGLLIYPVYKIRVRSEYLDEPAAAEPHYQQTVKVARWFDVKEHVIALGFAVALGLLWMVSAWNPKRDGDAIAPVIAGLAMVTAATTWFAAIVGLLVTSYRAI
jgi:hypothetical protein